jgi:dynein heavy chain
MIFFREGTEEVKRKTAEAKQMLQQWESSYMEVRAKIEASGRDQRWEFNKNDLFKDTKHMAEICQNLYDVAQVCYRNCKRTRIKKNGVERAMVLLVL